MKEFFVDFFFGFVIGCGAMVVLYMTVIATLLFIDTVKRYIEEWREKE